MRRTELLVPAGSLEVFRVAVLYGADAVYIGGEAFGLRAKAKNFSFEDMKEAVKFAHERGVRVYVTANILAHNDDLDKVESYFKELGEVGVDALIISDPGVFMIAKRVLPNMELHVSTQANCGNYAAAQVYRALGASRIVLAREMTLDAIAQLRARVPEDVELEAFVHGAMCMSYSGRCMISAYLTGRSANRGACAHPCRWNYTLMEQTRPGEYFPLEETDDGMALLSSRDLNCMPFLEQLVQAGVSSFKIEGRMKSEYYVATVVSAYRRRLDDILAGRPSDMGQLTHELDCVSHRPYCSGFYFGEVKHIGGDRG